MYLTFAWRYFKAKKSTNAINIISWVTAGVIAFSTMCQVLVLSVFNGFEDLVRSLYSNFYTDIRIEAANGKTINLTASQINDIRNQPGIKNVSVNAEEKALLQNGELQTVVFLKGVDESYREVSGVSRNMQNGSYQIGTVDTPLLILGSGVENALSIQADKNLSGITVFLPKRTAANETDPLASLSEGNANTAGSFSIQQDFDDKYVITNIDFVKQQMNFKADEYSSMEMGLKDPSTTEDKKKLIQNYLGKNYKVKTKYEQNTTLYNSMRLEKWAIFAIMTLVLIIAAFTMISALTMLVLEKRKDISVLQALGASQNLIKKIFLSEGLILAVVGATSGFMLALIICFLQTKFKLVKIEGNSFLIDYYPVKLLVTDFLLVAFTAVLIALLGSWFPAQKASTQPFQLRN